MSSVNEVSYAQSQQARRFQESLLVVKQQCPHFFVLPVVLEIAVIYFVVTNFVITQRKYPSKTQNNA